METQKASKSFDDTAASRGNMTLAVVLMVLTIALAGYFIVNSGKKNENKTPASYSVADSQVKIEEVKLGEGKAAKNGNKLTVHYTGTLTNGTKFDSSLDSGNPYEFTLGAGEVIKGWDIGLLDMQVGGKRKITIPPSLGYGSQSTGSIPANSTLVFEVELLAVAE